MQRLSYAKSQLTHLVHQIRPWVHQSITGLDNQSYAFVIVTIQDHISIVDAYIDNIGDRVQQRPLDLPAMQKEIQQLRVDITVALAAPVALPSTIPSMLVVDLFAPEEPI